MALSLRSIDHPCQGLPLINTFVILTKEDVDLKHLGLNYHLCLPLHRHLACCSVEYKGGQGGTESLMNSVISHPPPNLQ